MTDRLYKTVYEPEQSDPYAQPRSRSRLKSLFLLLRPTQWIKNGFVFMPLLFSGNFLVAADVVQSLIMAAAFCAASSATYILNDYADMERDKAHPSKKNRPLARGDLGPGIAMLVMFALIAFTIVLLFLASASPLCYAILLGYLAMQLCYSFVLKNVVIVDALTISAGFLLRVFGGAEIIEVEVSSWLILCTFSVAILLALGKRRHEVLLLNNGAPRHRPVLRNYSVQVLDQFLQLVTCSTFIFYCLYCVRGNPEVGIEPERMMFTIPVVTYGIFRYLYLVYHKEEGGSPTALLLTDAPLLACVVLWVAACMTVIYV
jgi:4-hydroxybenzoate polyprenyltransferase